MKNLPIVGRKDSAVITTITNQTKGVTIDLRILTNSTADNQSCRESSV
ncbi:hypothetical protein ACFSTE_14465 [Aquimarina hainanensis]|uniref:Uncharacterized protein n=1 Tax=Aquimarina hainanensis TaxID=1578017 RepID=A0ABW5NAK2_9FLAO|nr:hypothetical protein [Aquimarina sp. TRL1]QKX03611.1 hypothetical protein HN014_01335 [Aquimarina sp. TRL1]